MKNNYPTFSTGIASLMKAFSSVAVLYLTLLIFPFTLTHAQIYEPEGLNMPGAWNGWTNPPTNNLALASYTQVTGGRVTKISTGIPRWQTIFSVAESGGDLIGGTYDWLFTSGPTGTPFQNKWANVNVLMNTLQSYTFQGANDNNITLVNNKWYTVVWKDSGYLPTQAIFMETSAEPVNIASVSSPAGSIDPNQEVLVTITTSLAASAEEVFYVRYTINDWITSSVVAVNMSGSSGTATIPGQPEGTNVEYYAFSSTVASIIADFDLYTIHLNNNSGNFYAYAVVGTPTSEISWANLQSPASGTIESGQEFNVFARAFANGITNDPGQGAGIQAWIGYSTTDTNPDTWTNWIAATYFGDAASTDEYIANLGASLTELGTYYYASRFQLDDQDYVYGGYSAGGGGFWDGSLYVSGSVDVVVLPDPEITFANLQHPPSAEILIGDSVVVYAQVLAVGVALTENGYDGLTTWIGYSDADTHPNTWTNWYLAPYAGISGFTGRPEYIGHIGSDINTTGTYYYATRYQLDGGDFIYGGFSEDDGGFWDGTDHVSGILTVIEEIITFPVFFKVVDETESYQAIEFKGEMIEWATVPMDEDPEFTWTLTLDVAPGTYEWGVLENDGTEFGIWLIAGSNLVVTVGSNGEISGETTYTVTAPPTPEINWANLQHPPAGTIETAQEFNVYGRVWISGITGSGIATDGLQAWVGYHTGDTHPETWPNWIPATFNEATGDNDEFIANLGSAINEEGTYYYAYRYQYLDQDFVYGGYSEEGGGFWEAGVFVSGVLTIVTDLTPETLVVEGQTIGNEITECFDATNNITVSTTVIQNGANVEFRAGVSILFLGGFVVEAGGSMHALITDVYCQPPAMLRSKPTEIADELPLAVEKAPIVQVFPNPNSGKFRVKVSSADEFPVLKVEVFNMPGEQVFSNRYWGNQEYDIDLGTQTGGVYIVRLTYGNQVANERVIIR
ncbi:MAG: T9SS type A sorting domain-containing protein [Bacteroidales bacterium]|nr:T9SS type A sorting domain-containing protein [Bacteroidales bacterium]